jgi:NAD+-dependent protein deacetylase SIR2
MNSIPSLELADLLIVMGTSLTVHPFASLVDMVPKDCPRVLINLDRVGNFNKPDDVVCLGSCDEIVKDLCKKLGWEDELIKEWEKTAQTLEAVESTPRKAARQEDKRKESLAIEVDKITRDMALKLGLDDVEEQITDLQNQAAGKENERSKEKEALEEKLADKDGKLGRDNVEKVDVQEEKEASEEKPADKDGKLGRDDGEKVDVQEELKEVPTKDKL